MTTKQVLKKVILVLSNLPTETFNNPKAAEKHWKPLYDWATKKERKTLHKKKYK